MRHRKGGRPRILLALSLLLAACESPLEPLSSVRPMLASLTVETADGPAGGVLRIYATPRDAEFFLAANERIPILIRTGSGDMKDLLLRPEICGARGRSEHFCDRFVVVVKDGFDVQQLKSHAVGLPGRLLLPTLADREGRTVFTSRSFATVVVLDGDLDRAMARARRWPNVRYVEHSSFARIGSVGGETGRNRVTAVVPVVAAQAPGGSLLQVRAGEQISVEYEQPDGSRLTTTAVLEANH